MRGPHSRQRITACPAPMGTMVFMRSSNSRQRGALAPHKIARCAHDRLSAYEACLTPAGRARCSVQSARYASAGVPRKPRRARGKPPPSAAPGRGRSPVAAHALSTATSAHANVSPFTPSSTSSAVPPVRSPRRATPPPAPPSGNAHSFVNEAAQTRGRPHNAQVFPRAHIAHKPDAVRHAERLPRADRLLGRRPCPPDRVSHQRPHRQRLTVSIKCCCPCADQARHA